MRKPLILALAALGLAAHADTTNLYGDIGFLMPDHLAYTYGVRPF